MNKIYEKQTWHNDSAPALSEDNLNHIENGIDAIDTRLAGLAPADIGAVPNTRTVNGHALNENISLSASDVGLGDVPNVTTNNQTPTFNEASTRANIASGESLSTLFGKIKKWFSDLKTVALTGSYNDLTDKPTIPPGVTVDQTYDPTSTDAQSGTAVAQAVGGITFPVTGVKGGNNGEYKTGNVNLDPSDIGVTPFNAVIAGTRHLQYYRASHAAGWYDIARFNCDSIVTLHIEIFKNYGQSNQVIELNGFVTYFGSGDYENPGLKFEGVTQNITEYFSQFREGNEEDEEDLKYLQIKRETNDELVVAITPYYHARFGSPVANVTIFDIPAQTEMYDTSVKFYFTDYTGIQGANYGSFGSLNVKSVLGEWGIRADGRMSGDFDTAPTANSTRIVSSGGVHQALTDGSVTKIGTGTVGSATQPVYINGGVPTAMTGALAKANGGTGNTIGKGESVNVKTIPFEGTVNVDTFTDDTKGTAQFHLAAGSVADSPDNAWYNYLTMSASGTGGDYATQFALGATWGRIWFRNKNAGVWQPWHQIYGITTGTPTDINTHVSFISGLVQKTGNIVCVNLVFKLTSAWSPASSAEVLCKLPFGSAVTGTDAALTRSHEDSSNANTLIGAAFVKANGHVWVGTGPYNFVQNRYIRIYGTYLTND